MTYRLIHADVLEGLAELADESVQCVVTSPPYWGLRDYGIDPSVWGGDVACVHEWGEERSKVTGNAPSATRSTLTTNNGRGPKTGDKYTSENASTVSTGAFCSCGAWRGCLGLEPTYALYVEHIVAVFAEVWRVLRKDGTLWLNLGDSYATSAGNTDSFDPKARGRRRSKRPATNGRGEHQVDSEAIAFSQPNRMAQAGLKPKDLVGIPWMVAKALQAPRYLGRLKEERDRVWLAAMIDGEGTICGFDHDRADNGAHRSGIHVFITNSCAALLDEAARIWPTSRSEHGRPGPGHLGDLPTWRWIVHGIENKLAVLREVYPYLIAKRQQAIVAYSMLLLMSDAKRLGHSAQKDEVIAKRAVCTALLSDLNHARPVTMPDWLTEPPPMFAPGWWLRSDIIWHKPNPMPESVTDRPTKAHEMIFLLAKSERYFYDADAIREPAAYLQPNAPDAIKSPYGQGFTRRADPGPGISGLARGGGTHDAKSHNKEGRPKGNARTFRGGGAYTGNRSFDNDADVARESHGNAPNEKGTRNKRSVWTIATQPFPEAHFATFPEEIPRLCISAGSKVGDLVLDPFSGAGTTGLVALELGREYVGIERSAEYVAISERRLRQVNAWQPSLLTK